MSAEKQNNTIVLEQPFALSRYLSSSSSSKAENNNYNEPTANRFSTTTTSKLTRPQSAASIAKPRNAANSRPESSCSSSSSVSNCNIDANDDDDESSNEITPEYLKGITGFEELHLVSEAELTVDSKTQSVHLLSALLPNVVHLRLSRSNISSLRELGTSFTSLRVLWLSASGVSSLSGIQHIGEHLRELFLAFNHIKDVSPICAAGNLNHLEVLDLEGNLIGSSNGNSSNEGKNFCVVNDLISLRNLPALKSLNLAGNPFISMLDESNGRDENGDDDDDDDDDEEDRDDYRNHIHTYHKLILSRIDEVLMSCGNENTITDDGEANIKKAKKNNSKIYSGLEYLDDTPIDEIRAKVKAVESRRKLSSHHKQNEKEDNDDDGDVFDGSSQQKNNNNNENNTSSTEKEEQFTSARRRLQSRKEIENKRNDPLFRTLFDELSLLQNAIRTQLGKSGEQLVAEEQVRSANGLMSRQRSLAPEEEKQRLLRAAKNSDSLAITDSVSNKNTGSSENQPPSSHRPTPPTLIAKPPLASSTNSSRRNSPPQQQQQENNDDRGVGDDEESNVNNVVGAVGSLVHRLRSSKKQNIVEGGTSPEKEQEQEERMTMAEILAKKIADSNTRQNSGNGKNGQRDPHLAAHRRKQMEETDKLLDAIDARYNALLVDNNDEKDDDDDDEDANDDKKLFKSWLPPSSASKQNNSKFSDPSSLPLTNDADKTTRASSSSNSSNSSSSRSSFEVERPSTAAAKSHKARMYHARKLLDLANKKKDKAEKKLQEKTEKMDGRKKNTANKNDDDDDDTACSRTSSSSTYTSSSTRSTSTSSYTSTSSIDSRKQGNNNSANIRSRAVAPISDTEVLQKVLEDKEVALAKLKKDIAGREGFLMSTSTTTTARSRNEEEKFEPIDWQGDEAGSTENTL